MGAADVPRAPFSEAKQSVSGINGCHNLQEYTVKERV